MKKPASVEPHVSSPVTAYALSVVNGHVPACRWVKLACQRHLTDLERAATDPEFGFYFDPAEAARRIEFCTRLRHYKGTAKGKAFRPESWQGFIIGSVFGWKRRADGLRRFRYALVVVPRKNGKTYLAASVAIQMLIGGGNLRKDGRFSPEAGAEVYFVATNEAQARIGWRDAVRIIKRSPGFSDILASRVSEIRYDDQDAICRPLGADSDSLDGLNPSCAIKDELHAWKDRALWDVIEEAFGAREQPLAFVISTEGNIRGGIFDEQLTHAQNILEGGDSYRDDAYFAVIYTADEGDDPFAEATWFKANPNLGVSKSLDYMRDQAAKARLLPGKRASFLTKQLNIRSNAETQWIGLDVWDRCAGELSLQEIENWCEGRPCSIGLDLARVIDMSSACFLFREGDVYTAFWRYWYPSDVLRESADRDRVPYDQWARDGLINATDGDVTDFNEIETDLKALADRFSVMRLAYDPMFATDLAIRLRDGDAKVPIAPFTQTFTNYTLPCDELERILIGKKLVHGGNAIARWNAGNVVVRKGPSGNRMPDKGKSRGRIDGAVALLMALDGFLRMEPDQKSVYASRGLIAI